MKAFLMTFALCAVSNMASATDYSFKQSQIHLKGTIKNSATNTTVPIFDLKGTAMWTEENDAAYRTLKAQVTIRRTTYNCDYANDLYDGDYSCEFEAKNFQQILDDLVTHDDEFTVAQGIIKRYFDDSYYDTVKIPLGTLDQVGETTVSKTLTDPDNPDMAVEIEMSTTGMTPL